MVYTHRLLASSSWLILFCCCLWIDLVALVLGDGGDGRPLEVVGNSTITATLEQQEEQQRRQLINENTASSGVSSQEEEEQQQQLAKIHAEHLSLFSVCDSIATLGPTVFPKPTHIFEKDVDNNDDDDPNDEIVTYIQPSHGQHRPNQDAILLFAAEYSLQNYLVF